MQLIAVLLLFWLLLHRLLLLLHFSVLSSSRALLLPARAHCSRASCFPLPPRASCVLLARAPRSCSLRWSMLLTARCSCLRYSLVLSALFSPVEGLAVVARPPVDPSAKPVLWCSCMPPRAGHLRHLFGVSVPYGEGPRSGGKWAVETNHQVLFNTSTMHRRGHEQQREIDRHLLDLQAWNTK